MPCYSRVTTKMTNAARVAEAARAAGFTVLSASDVEVRTAEGLRLGRGDAKAAFTAAGALSTLAAVARKYAEIVTREWARARGLVVRQANETGMTLVSTRS